MKYHCIESLLEVELGDTLVRVWINRQPPFFYAHQDLKVAQALQERWEGRQPAAQSIIEWVVENVENVNAVQVSMRLRTGIRAGIVVYTVPFDDHRG